jgi:thioredoxin-like negative regulator of GroEL
MLAPLLVKVSEIANDIQFIKVDIDQVPTIASQLNIRSIPTVYLFKDGKPINFFVGYKTEPEILQFINENKK